MEYILNIYSTYGIVSYTNGKKWARILVMIIFEPSITKDIQKIFLWFSVCMQNCI